MDRGKARAILTVAVAFLMVALWLSYQHSHAPGPKAPALTESTPFAKESPPLTGWNQQTPAGGHGPGAGQSATAPPSQQPAAPAAAPSEALPAANQGPAGTSSIDRNAAMTELFKVHQMILSYHTLMGQNPVGTNAEIMKAIMGGNAHQAMLGPPEGQTLNGKGELLDPWGTPYFFHQLSGDHMEIRSAGPDRIMYTEDDVVMP